LTAITLPHSFFHVLVAHLHLTSFPTRRSSDLALHYSAQGRVATHSIISPVRSKSGMKLHQLRYFVTVAEELHFGHRDEVPELMEDRKSTRLNSSHVAISYAVFCLKTKNNNIP